SGGTLERILQKSTDKLYKSIGFGIITTTIMQSSSLVSVLTISFLGAGLIGLAQGIGIIFGANIGTTTGAWLVAGFGLKVKISAYAMPMLVFGVILIFQKAKSLKGIGYILAGLGFLFLGIHYMKDGFEAFKSTIDLASFGGTGLKYLFIFTGIGVFATVVMQSSHATLVLIITALAVGQISYENALALAIGANVGTTITAIIGAMSSNIQGKRLAGAHLIFNMVTGLIAIVFMSQLIYAVDFTSNLIGIANDDHTLKLAVFHTIFNFIGVLVMIPFIGKLVIFLESTLKDSSGISDKECSKVKYLNDSILELPAIAMTALTKETKHLYENAFRIITHGLNLKQSNVVSTMPLAELVKETYSQSPIDIDKFYNCDIKGIYGEIIDFSTKAQSLMRPEDIEKLYKLKLANRDIVEAVKGTKHLQKNLIVYSNSSNKYIKKRYNMIRQDLAELLRDIHTIASSKEEDEILILLSKVKIHTEKYDIIANGILDNLIRNRLITNEMATSLMNDTVYAYNISTNLIAMAEVIFLENNSDMLMSDKDINLMVNKEN
ncbi:Na/Pi cotransporter family protein, partial [Sulfurovum sp. bin170]|uniref:Na/Pi cotransporter family protein n=1 Tax=Sulfurovum sp. bin170 TaxID=2695268 RepID=UPI0013DE809A